MAQLILLQSTQFNLLNWVLVQLTRCEELVLPCVEVSSCLQPFAVVGRTEARTIVVDDVGQGIQARP